MRPQAPGAGVANPFRASMLAPDPGPGPGAGSSFPASFGGYNAGAGLFAQPTGAQTSFGQGLFVNGGLQADASKRQNGAASSFI